MFRNFRRRLTALICVVAVVVLTVAFLFFFPDTAKKLTRAVSGFVTEFVSRFADTDGVFGPKKSEDETEAGLPEVSPVPDGFDYYAMPEWDGSAAFIQVNGGEPFFSEEERAYTDTFEYYSDQDDLGRCGYAFANLDMSLLPEEERGEIASVYPSGWNQAFYPELIEDNDGALFNRCHLIAFALAGENDNPLNLITGTRYFNVNGMEEGIELEVLFWIYDHPDQKVLYRVTPVYVGDELVCRGVLIEARSSDGSLNRCIYCYNVQPGIAIDYRNGSSSRK